MLLFEISGCHGGEYEDDSLLGRCAGNRPVDGGSKHL
jgi:hypothetical protein